MVRYIQYFTRAYLSRNSRGEVILKISEEDLSENEVGIGLGGKLYSMAISTPYGCVIALSLELTTPDMIYAALALLNPLNSEDTQILEKIISSREIHISLGERILGVYRLSEAEVDRLSYTMSKTRECDIMRSVEVDLDKAYEWIISSLG
ncbi:MAG: hypothetical protein QXE32_02910 [Sulfolobales archaeon]